MKTIIAGWAVASLVVGGMFYAASHPVVHHDMSISARPFVKYKDGLVTVGLHPLNRDSK